MYDSLGPSWDIRNGHGRRAIHWTVPRGQDVGPTERRQSDPEIGLADSAVEAADDPDAARTSLRKPGPL